MVSLLKYIHIYIYIYIKSHACMSKTGLEDIELGYYLSTRDLTICEFC